MKAFGALQLTKAALERSPHIGVRPVAAILLGFWMVKTPSRRGVWLILMERLTGCGQEDSIGRFAVLLMVWLASGTYPTRSTSPLLRRAPEMSFCVGLGKWIARSHPVSLGLATRPPARRCLTPLLTPLASTDPCQTCQHGL